MQTALAGACRAANPSAEILACANLAEALKKSANEKFVVITGSLYLVGEALELLGLSPAGESERGLNEWSAAAQPASPSDKLAEEFPEAVLILCQRPLTHQGLIIKIKISMAYADTLLPQRRFGETTRPDAWWVQPLVVFLGFSAFIVYSTWAAFQGVSDMKHGVCTYWFGGLHGENGGANYLSPFYSPEFWGISPHAIGKLPSWWPAGRRSRRRF